MSDTFRLPSSKNIRLQNQQNHHLLFRRSLSQLLLKEQVVSMVKRCPNMKCASRSVSKHQQETGLTHLHCKTGRT